MDSGGMTSILVLMLLLLLPSVSTDKVYYVTPSSNDPCSSAVNQHSQCITLSQFASKSSDYLESNTTLILLPGTHLLNSALNVSDRESFIMTSNLHLHANSTLINCNGTGRFEFKWVSYVGITAIKFTGCGGTRLLLSEQLVIEASIFEGEKGDGTAIELLYTNAHILKTLFINNKANYVYTDQNLTLGGALILTESNVVIVESSFMNNGAGVGGAIYGEFSRTSISIVNSTFIGNHASTFGGALYFQFVEESIPTNLKLNSTDATMMKPSVRVYGCHFGGNNAGFAGGVFTVYDVNLDISSSQFIGNWALHNGGFLTGQSRLIINIDNCTFYKNFAAYGGVISLVLNKNVSLTANGNRFFKNSAIIGGVLLAGDGGRFTFAGNKFFFNAATDTAGAIALTKNSTLHADTNIFFNNTATIGAVLYTEGPDTIHSVIKNCTLDSNMINDSGGIIDVSKATFLTLENTQLINNSAKYFAGFIIDAMLSPTVTVTDSRFVRNSVGGSVIIVGVSGTLHLFSSYFINNTGAGELVHMDDSVTNIEDCEFINNLGSVYAFNSRVIFSGSNNFTGLSPEYSYHSVGGALTVIQSQFVFESESCTLLERNSAYNGGAIFATESALYVHGQMTVTENLASNSGGGIYLYQSGLYCYGCTLHISNNTASNRGGGVQAIGSAIKIYFHELISHVCFEYNQATKGGAVSFESNGNLLIFMYDLHQSNAQDIYFTGNSAVDGGAIYVNDEPSCLNSDHYENVQPEGCFLQIFRAYQNTSIPPNRTSLNFEQNYAYSEGSVLFGGLLDRCTIDHHAIILFNCTIAVGIQPECLVYYDDGVNYITHVSNVDIDSISSKPVRVCFCETDDFMPNCSYQPAPIRIKKGGAFTISIAAVDQVNHTLDAEVHSYLDSEKGGIGSGQMIQKTGTNCTNITFSVISPYDKENIIMYADGPCKDSSKSLKKLEVHFAPCSCPVGFQVNENTEKFRCDCECASELLPCLSPTSCNSSTRMIAREKNCWIASAHTDKENTNNSGYLIHMHCPLDYCKPPSSITLVNLNLPNGSDMQCANRRRGILCGRCKQNHSLSLGSNRCIPCPNNWPLLCAAILVAAIASGIVVVALILMLNLTVAVGTLNGIIFYANVVAANGAIFLPSAPNFASIFIAWLNLDIGFDTCFFNGMDAYWKTWLQFVFPAYVIILVVVIICICEHSTRFAQFLGKKNPVATLATLILLSYTKVLQSTITAFSVTTLNYPDGTRKIVWLPDASISYFHGKHILLFIAAVCILLIGSTYTIVLFSWQWLLRYQDMRIFRWVRHQKLRLFLEPYHAPYTFKHRYWTGLLLLARVVLYVVVAVNIDNDPRVNLLTIGLIVSGLIALKGSAGIDRVYRQWPVEVLDTVCYFNIISLTFVSLFFVETAEQNFVAAYVSVTITVALLVIVLLFRLFNEVSCLKKVWKMMILKLKLSSNSSSQTSGTPPVPTHTYLPAILEFNREEEDNEESTRNEQYHETCSDSGSVTSPLLEDVATY